MNPLARLLIALAAALFLALVAGAACAVSRSGGFLYGADWKARAERVEQRALSFQPGTQLRAHSAHGSIRVRASATEPPGLVATLVANGADDADARATLDAARLIVEESATIVSIRVEQPESRGWNRSGVSAAFELVVPPDCPMQIDSSSGNIRCEQGPFGATRLRSTHGALSIQNVRGELSMDSSSGEVVASDVEGASAVLHSTHGVVRLSRARAPRIELSASSGEVEANDVQGESVRLASTHGALIARDVHGALALRASSGEVTVERHVGLVEVDATHGEVRIEGVLQGLRVKSSSGDVRVRASATSRVEGAWSVEATHGDVTLELPEASAFALDAKTSHGKVEVGFPIEVSASQAGKSKELSGKVHGGGSGSLRLRASSGDVRVVPSKG